MDKCETMFKRKKQEKSKLNCERGFDNAFRQETEQEINIKENEQRVYRIKDISLDEESELEDQGYQKVLIRDLKGQQNLYLFKPFFHESPRHAITVFEIVEYLKKFHNIKVKQYLSRSPDIVFEVNKKKYAIEVETGTILKRNKDQIYGKIANLKYYYHRNWFFVVTDRNLVKSYKRFGKTYSKRNILGKIYKIIIHTAWL